MFVCDVEKCDVISVGMLMLYVMYNNKITDGYYERICISPWTVLDEAEN